MYEENVEKSFSQNILKTNGWNLQCMIKIVIILVTIKFWPLGIICPCPWAIYMYKIVCLYNIMSSSLKPLEQFLPDYMGRYVERVLTICSNYSAPLKKMAVMQIYGKILKNLLLQNQESFEA